MNWFKLAAHDLRAGIFRVRYLAVPVIFCMPCFSCMMRQYDRSGGWLDFLAFCFKGTYPLFSGLSDFEFPILWFLVMGGCLFLNLDYPLNDLTEAGQQVLVRSVSKKGWFLSKCLWNLLSCGVYLLLGAMTAFVFAVLSGGGMGLSAGPAFYEQVMGMYVPNLTELQVTIGAILLPYLTIAAFNMLQMVLCLFVKPIFSFLICICMLVVSLFLYTPFALGNGAMVVRCVGVAEGVLDLGQTALFCGAVIICTVIIGLVRFDRMDFLRYEG